MDAQQKRLLAAASSLSNEYDFYSPCFDHMRFDKSDDVPTIGVNAKLVLSYNADFIKTLDDTTLKGVLMHEAMHFLSEHHRRELENPIRKMASHELHNIAMDMEINGRLKNMGFRLPDEGCFPDNFKLPDGTVLVYPDELTYEQYFKKLLSDLRQFLKNNPQYLNQGNDEGDCEDQEGKGGTSISIDMGDGSTGKMDSPRSKGDDVQEGDSESGGYTADTDNLVDDLKDKGEAKAAKSRGEGSLSSPNEVRVEAKKYPWNTIFRNVVAKSTGAIIQGYEFKSYNYFNKRNQCEEIILPTWKARKCVINLVVIMDVSGSMYNLICDMYAKMKSMARMISDDLKITILETDTEVINVIKDFDLSSRVIHSANGGGTDLTCAWRYIEEHKMNPDMIICMSDGYTPWPSKEDSYFMKSKTTCILEDRLEDCPYRAYRTDFGG